MTGAELTVLMRVNDRDDGADFLRRVNPTGLFGRLLDQRLIQSCSVECNCPPVLRPGHWHRVLTNGAAEGWHNVWRVTATGKRVVEAALAAAEGAGLEAALKASVKAGATPARPAPKRRRS